MALSSKKPVGGQDTLKKAGADDDNARFVLFALGEDDGLKFEDAIARQPPITAAFVLAEIKDLWNAHTGPAVITDFITLFGGNNIAAGEGRLNDIWSMTKKLKLIPKSQGKEDKRDNTKINKNIGQLLNAKKLPEEVIEDLMMVFGGTGMMPTEKEKLKAIKKNISEIGKKPTAAKK